MHRCGDKRGRVPKHPAGSWNGLCWVAQVPGLQHSNPWHFSRCCRSRLVTAAVGRCGFACTQRKELSCLQACDSTFLDAIGGGDTLLFRKGLELAGYADKLPSPEIGVTILVPNNKAWWDFLWKNGFLLDQLSSVGDKLLSVMTFHIIPSAVTPEMLSSTPEGA